MTNMSRINLVAMQKHRHSRMRLAEVLFIFRFRLKACRNDEPVRIAH